MYIEIVLVTFLPTDFDKTLNTLTGTDYKMILKRHNDKQVSVK